MKILLAVALAILMPLAHAYADIYDGVVGEGYSPPVLEPTPLPEPPVTVLPWVAPVDVDGIYLIESNGVELVLSIHSEGDTYVMFVMNNSETIFDTFVGTWALGEITFNTFDYYSSVASSWKLRFRPGGGIYGVQSECYTIFNTYDCTFPNGTEFIGERAF